MSELKVRKLLDEDGCLVEVFDADETIRYIARHKYKRCLAMAERCEWERRFWTNSVLAGEGKIQWAKWAEKWHKRWLELAEKFKEE